MRIRLEMREGGPPPGRRLASRPGLGIGRARPAYALRVGLALAPAQPDRQVAPVAVRVRPCLAPGRRDVTVGLVLLLSGRQRPFAVPVLAPLVVGAVGLGPQVPVGLAVAVVVVGRVATLPRGVAGRHAGRPPVAVAASVTLAVTTKPAAGLAETPGLLGRTVSRPDVVVVEMDARAGHTNAVAEEPGARPGLTVSDAALALDIRPPFVGLNMGRTVVGRGLARVVVEVVGLRVGPHGDDGPNVGPVLLAKMVGPPSHDTLETSLPAGVDARPPRPEAGTVVNVPPEALGPDPETFKKTGP